MRVALIYTVGFERVIQNVRFVQILNGVLLVTTTKGEVAFAPGQWLSYELEMKDV